MTLLSVNYVGLDENLNLNEILQQGSGKLRLKSLHFSPPERHIGVDFDAYPIYAGSLYIT